MTHHERTMIADRCARCDGAPDAQALLAEARAQLEEARRERDEAREKARVSDRCRLANEAELRRADEQISHLRTALAQSREKVRSLEWHRWNAELVAEANRCQDRAAERTIAAEQALLAEKALAAEKAALVTRVGVLSAALRELASAVEQYEPNDGDDLADLQWKAEHARAALEVDP